MQEIFGIVSKSFSECFFSLVLNNINLFNINLFKLTFHLLCGQFTRNLIRIFRVLNIPKSMGSS